MLITGTEKGRKGEDKRRESEREQMGRLITSWISDCKKARINGAVNEENGGVGPKKRRRKNSGVR